MSTRQAFVSEAFHPEDSIRQVWNDLMERACAKAVAMGGVFAEPGGWSVQPPLDDDDDCFHVRLMFSVSVPDLPAHPDAINYEFVCRREDLMG